MEKQFGITVLHETEIMNEVDLEVLKGGTSDCGCDKLQSCGCFKAANGSCGNRNEVQPDTIKGKSTNTTDTLA